MNKKMILYAAMFLISSHINAQVTGFKQTALTPLKGPLNSVVPNKAKSQIAVLLEGSDQVQNVEKLFFKTTKLPKEASYCTFIVGFTSAENNYPGNSIGVDVTTKVSNLSKKKGEVDLSSYEIEIPTDGLFATISWDVCYDRDDQIVSGRIGIKQSTAKTRMPHTFVKAAKSDWSTLNYFEDGNTGKYNTMNVWATIR